ncbi:hypothetical protein [Rhodanobacter sp. MP7CTX1]|jgi:protein O-mannosyl-transferase|uniref:hypothetical protein n=1 Tax=Rhodanobacter sp. MP7CTX1 TaxID=2723084 RepID=UPI001608D7A0|nr:hypothetical protein [Rhodanobacter sp. MP7CTX1]MBB6187257.1 hypothetical protein [Rhodanobacter sp. MP7CTX1]
MINAYLRRHVGAALFIFSLILVAAIYWPGLSGSWLFDDYPNIIDDQGVQPSELSIPALVHTALSSPASDFKRPLVSLSPAIGLLLANLEYVNGNVGCAKLVLTRTGIPHGGINVVRK